MGQFKKGEARLPNAGRKKGTPNVKTLMLEKIFELNGYSPSEELLKLLPSLDEKDQAKVHLELMQYLYPKRKELPDLSEEDTFDVTPENEFDVAAETLEYIESKYPQLIQAKVEVYKKKQ